MALHNQLGKEGEQMATAYFEQKNYTILHRNWRYNQYEIDIIAFKNNVVHIIEVKLRTSRDFALPEHAVNKKKFRDLTKAADEFLSQHPEYRYVQFDILAINVNNDGTKEYFLIEDIFL